MSTQPHFKQISSLFSGSNSKWLPHARQTSTSTHENITSISNTSAPVLEQGHSFWSITNPWEPNGQEELVITNWLEISIQN